MKCTISLATSGKTSHINIDTNTEVRYTHCDYLQILKMESIDEGEFSDFLDTLFCDHKVTQFREPATLDTTSGTVLPHLSFILNLLLPKWAIIEGPISRFQQLSHSHMTNPRIKHKGLQPADVEIVPAGSVPDGIFTPPYVSRDDTDRSAISETVDGIRWYDLDILIMRKTPVIEDKFLDTSSTYPGYCRWINASGGYYTQDSVDLTCISEIKEAQLVRSGPAWTDKTFLQPFDIDYVPTLPCKSWHRQAEPWITRHRASGWPSEDVIRDIVASSCHLVAKAHPNSDRSEIEWRLSFVIAEQKLIKCLLPIQKQAYIICKLLVKYVLTPESSNTSLESSGMSFSTYCLKTTLFWSMEKTPPDCWADYGTGLAVGVLSILDNLIQFLASHSVPMYFIPENNIIEHIPRRDIRQNYEKVLELRHNLLSVVLEFDNKYYIEDVSHIRSLQTILTDINTYTTVSETPTKAECARIQLEELIQFVAQRVMAFRVDLWGAVCTCEYLIGRIKELEGSCSCVVGSYSGIRLIRACAVEMASDHAEMSREIISCSAVVMSAVYLRQQARHDTTSREDAESVQDMFEEVITMECQSALVHVYYAMFLMCRRRSERAQAVLDMAIACDEDTRTLLSEYFAVVPGQSLERTLRHVTSLSVVFDIPAHILVRYLQVMLNIGREPATVLRLLRALHDASDKLVKLDHNVVYESCQLLLAHTYLALGDIEQAVRILSKDGVRDVVLGDNDTSSLVDRYKQCISQHHD